MARHIRKGDTVEIIAGNSKGSKGRIMRILSEGQRVIVEGHNMAYKHVRPTQKNPQGGRIRIEKPIHISNVQPLDPKTSKGTRCKVEIAKNGEKKLVAMSGAEIRVIAKAKKAK